jgi:thiol-disulfide isomerase/thioredoxin
MKLLNNVSELELLRPFNNRERVSLLLIASTNCGACAEFKPIYEKLENKIGNCCDFYVAIAEKMGGRQVLREAFRGQFDRRYSGFPSLFVVLNKNILEIPYGTVMWNEKTRNFDENAIIEYLEKNKVVQRVSTRRTP